MKELMYFAHCYLEYNTELEKQLMDKIVTAFEDDYEIINPKIFGMSELDNYLKIVGACDSIVFHPFENKMVLSGVAKEVRLAFELNKPVYRIILKAPFSGTSIIEKINLEEFEQQIILGLDQTRKLLREEVAAGKYPEPTWWK